MKLEIQWGVCLGAIRGQLFGIIGLGLALCPSTPALAQTYTYTTLNDPLATSSTVANGINDRGQIVGYYTGPGQTGFLYNGGNYSTLDDPLATSATVGQGINNQGRIVGYYRTGIHENGFLYSGGIYTTLDGPGFGDHQATGINDKGQIVGFTNSGSSGTHSFIYKDGNYTLLDHPLADRPFDTTAAFGINNRSQVVGYFQNGSGIHGFFYDKDNYTNLDYPVVGSVATVAYGINDSGQIVGKYQDANLAVHGFLYDHGNYTTVDDPLAWFGRASGSYAVGINNRGQIVGSYDYYDGGVHLASGFLATPASAPGPVAGAGMPGLILVIGGLLGWRRALRSPPGKPSNCAAHTLRPSFGHGTTLLDCSCRSISLAIKSARFR